MKYYAFLALLMVLKVALCSELVERHDEEEISEHSHEEVDGFDLLVNETGSPIEGKLNRRSIQEILDRLHEPCLSADSIFSTLGLENADGLTEEEFAEAAYLIAYAMLQKSEEGSCPGFASSVDYAKNHTVGAGEVCRSNISSLIESFMENEKFVPRNDNKECFGSATILSHCTTDREEIDEAVMNLVISMARGLCLLPEPQYFENELLEYFNENEEMSLSKQGFEELLEKLNIGEVHEVDNGHDHEGEHDHENGHSHEEDHDDEDEHDHKESHEGEDKHGHEDDHDDEHEHGHEEGHEGEDEHGNEEDHDDEDEHGHEDSHEGEDEHGHEDDHDDEDEHGHEEGHEGEDEHGNEDDHDDEDEHGHEENHEGEDEHGNEQGHDDEDEHGHEKDDENEHSGEEGHDREDDHDDEEHGHGEDHNGIKHVHEDKHGDEEGEHRDDDDDDHNIHMNVTNTNEHEELKDIKKCYSPSQLLTIAGNEKDAMGNTILTKAGLMRICPALLQQHVSKACIEEHVETPPAAVASYTQAKKYGYGTLAVFIISLLAFIGLLLFPSVGTVGYKLTMQFFIALGVGALSGDALLHLIPGIVGLHRHGAGDSHDHEEEEDQTYLYKLLVVIVGIYIFFLFENALRLYNQITKKNLSLNQHHHNDRKHSHLEPGREAGTHNVFSRVSISTQGDKAESGTDHLSVPEGNGVAKPHVESDIENEKRPDSVCCGITPVGLMVFIGDILHNLGDGLAIGVAFSVSPVTGIGASIAIFCHELPHEFGDFAIYMKNGMSKWQALGMNFLAACGAFIGLYIGLSVAEDEEARQWMLAIVAGMFLYISLVVVLHEMIEEVSDTHPLTMFFLQNLGICLGWVILLLIALYEDNLRQINMPNNSSSH